MKSEKWWDENWQWVTCFALLVLFVAYLNRASIVAMFPALASALLRDGKTLGGQSMNRIRLT
jgi:hypothetical protein